MDSGSELENEKSLLIGEKIETRSPRICKPVHPAVYGSIVILVVSSVVVFLSVRSPKQDVGNVQMLSSKQSVAGVYKQGAVISDYEQCSKIGSDLMRLHNGSAVDAAVATTLCIGVTNIQACGIGGGLFMTIYDTPNHKARKVAVTVNGRERAPLAAHRDMFKDVEDPGMGARAIAVPGELRGLYVAWKGFGRLPWQQIVQPAINIARRGFTITPQQEGNIVPQMKHFKRFPGLRKFLTKDDGTLYGAGDIMKRPRLADTLERIRDEGPGTFYTGSLANDIIADIRDAGGIMTLKDLKEYRTKVERPMSVRLPNGNIDLLVPPLPSGGPIVQFMLRIMNAFDFSHQSKQDLELNVNLHQAFIETFKFAFAMRSYLGDADFVDVTEPMRNLTRDEFIQDIRSRIDLNRTHSLEYYHAAYAPARDHGTAHVSVSSPDGAAVAVTTSINYYFGSMIVGKRTGIVFNNEMDDFSTPDSNNEWGLRPSKANYIAPKKRPLSSMVPAILLDHVTKQPRLVIGGSGGSEITPMVAWVTYLNQQCGLDLLSAVDFPRVHHQLLPATVSYEKNKVADSIIDGLRAKGHRLEPKSSIAVINGIHRPCDVTGLCVCTAVGDCRRGGRPWGWN